MIRRLVDYKKLDHKLATLLIKTYPYGYGDEDIIIFKNAQREIIEAVEIQTEDTLYLVKIGKSLTRFISNFEENIEKQLVTKPATIIEGAGADKAEKDFKSHQKFEKDFDIE